jgi:hypothetical protein
LIVAAGVLAATTPAALISPLDPPDAQALSKRENEVIYWRTKVRDQRVRAVTLNHQLGGTLRLGRPEMHTISVPFLQWMFGAFKKRGDHLAAVKRDRFPKLLCIHRLEGSWTAYNPAGYYGGFQMDWNFMRQWGPDRLGRYGGRDARSWHPSDQMAVASRAVAHIGFGPWPNTARACGLL